MTLKMIHYRDESGKRQRKEATGTVGEVKAKFYAWNKERHRGKLSLIKVKNA